MSRQLQSIESASSPRYSMWLMSSLGAIAFVAAGCGQLQPDHSNLSTSPTVMATDSASVQPIVSPSALVRLTQSSACSLRPVLIGSRLTEGNLQDINGQLATLAMAYDSSGKVKSRDVVHAAAIVADAFIDPAYAAAFAAANTDLSDNKNVTGQQLLNSDYAQKIQRCSPSSSEQTVQSSQQQIHQVDELYKSLLNGLLPKAETQFFPGPKDALDRLDSQYKNFSSTYE